MPRRGYRKGQSDTKEPCPYSVRTHITAREYQFLIEQSDSRSLTLSKLLRSLVSAFVANTRVQLPQPRLEDNAIRRDLNRLGNNLNQISKHANQLRLHLLEHEALETVRQINAAVRRLRSDVG